MPRIRSSKFPMDSRDAAILLKWKNIAAKNKTIDVDKVKEIITVYEQKFLKALRIISEAGTFPAIYFAPITHAFLSGSKVGKIIENYHQTNPRKAATSIWEFIAEAALDNRNPDIVVAKFQATPLYRMALIGMTNTYVKVAQKIEELDSMATALDALPSPDAKIILENQIMLLCKMVGTPKEQLLSSSKKIAKILAKYNKMKSGLVMAYLRMAITATFTNPIATGIGPLDRFQAATAGLSKAVDTYIPTKGSFSSYAKTWANHFVTAEEHTAYYPNEVAMSTMATAMGEEGTAEDSANYNLNSEVYEEDTPEDLVIEMVQREEAKLNLNLLNEQERELVCLYFGLFDYLAPKGVSDKLTLVMEKVRQLIANN